MRLSANQNLYKDNEGLNSDFINKSFGSNIIWFAGKGWTLDTKMDVNIYGQGSFQGSTNINLWQAAIAKAFFNNVLTTKILAFDLLNQNQGIARTASETFISESLSNTIGRYFMVSVQYNINAIGAPKRNDRIMIMRN